MAECNTHAQCLKRVVATRLRGGCMNIMDIAKVGFLAKVGGDTGGRRVFVAVKDLIAKGELHRYAALANAKTEASSEINQLLHGLCERRVGDGTWLVQAMMKSTSMVGSLLKFNLTKAWCEEELRVCEYDDDSGNTKGEL